jgi:cytochrome c oxidase subunit 2
MRFPKSLLLVGGLALVLGACGGEYPQSSIDPRTDFAETIQGLYRIVFVWSMVILAVVWALLAYVLVRFRERPGAPLPRQTHGNLGLEIAWTLAPALIVVAIAVPTIQAVFASQRGDPENALVVEVIGHQFWWEFRYPDQQVVTANELHLPVGQPVSLRIHSADVIHSFWVPMLGGKRDANPLVARPEGEPPEYNWLHFTVLEAGEYMGQCAEFCGPSHSLMGIRVIAESPEDFQAWLDDWRAPPGEEAAAPAVEGLDPALVAQGREIFHNQTCVACHAIQGTNAQGPIAPNLTLLGRRTTIAAGWLENTVEGLERWIRAPREVKPGALMPGIAEGGGNWPATGLTDDQVRAVAQYLYSLR